MMDADNRVVKLCAEGILAESEGRLDGSGSDQDINRMVLSTR
jgi:hypothetical protein